MYSSARHEDIISAKMRAHHLLESYVGREAHHGIVNQGGGYFPYSYKKLTEYSIHTRNKKVA